ncbi:MAG: DUF4190 domain-containing protein [Actinocatenispora sp.]
MDNHIGTAVTHPQFGYHAPAYPTAVPAMPPRPAPRTEAMAIASLVVSVHGVALPGVGVVGAILGHVARGRIARSGDEGSGLALAGVVVGWVTTGLYALLFAAFVLMFVALAS